MSSGIVGTGQHLQAIVPSGHRQICAIAPKRNIASALYTSNAHVTQRHAQRNKQGIVCNSTSQAEGSRGNSATSWAVQINRNIVVAVDASEVGFRPLWSSKLWMLLSSLSY